MGPANSGGQLMQRPNQQPYSPMRGGPMQNPPGGVKRPQDSRGPMPQSKKYVKIYFCHCLTK